MFNKTMLDWLDSFDSDQPAPDGAWANAWNPVWDEAPASPLAARPVETSAHANPRLSRGNHAGNFAGSTLNHG